jgi:hypothetical protein
MTIEGLAAIINVWLRIGRGNYMKATMLAAALLLAASASVEPALGDQDRAEQERDCTNDALTWCSQYIFAPDRDEQIGYCLWEHRTQISRACRSHLRPPKRPLPR